MKKVESELVCKATASLDRQVASELDQEDKSIKDLLDEKEIISDASGGCKRGCTCSGDGKL